MQIAFTDELNYMFRIRTGRLVASGDEFICAELHVDFVCISTVNYSDNEGLALY